MTVTTLNRRSFFQKLRSNTEEKPVERTDFFGNKIELFAPISSQELPLVPPPTTTIALVGGLEPYTGPWDYEQAAHLLRRTTFGLKKSDLETLMSLSMDEAVDKLLGINEPAYMEPAPPVYNYYNPIDNDGYEEVTVPANLPFYDGLPALALGETWVDRPYNNDAEGYRTESFRGWWLNLMLGQGISIRERMTLFWHNHFATQTESVFYGKVCYNHNQLLRGNALGNFKELTKLVTKDVMMLFYLNGYLNNKDAPDENYARELQELFTIGKDNPDHYTEEDVVQAARVLTGWTIDWNTYYTDIQSVFYTGAHDQGDKQFSAFYNNTIIQGGTDGETELDALLTMIFDKNEVSEYLCRKLYRWFVYYHIDATTEQNVIQPLAQIFRDNNYDILPVLETLLKSTHFFDAVNKGCYIKTPVDVVIGSMRSFNMDLPSNTMWDDFVIKYFLRNFLESMQMLPGDPPNVAGWQAYRQSPQFYRMWINSNTSRNRNFYIYAMFSGGLATSQTNIMQFDAIDFASQFSDPGNAVTLIDEVTKLLLPPPVSDTMKAFLKAILLSGAQNDSYWTVAWFSYADGGIDQQMWETVLKTRLNAMLGYLMTLPEFQLA
ncbi:MAG: DUF1800 family protein [Bacteroidetes bacterium]|nr:DUF1800 family protein [Bacteroidota bacterium]